MEIGFTGINRCSYYKKTFWEVGGLFCILPILIHMQWIITQDFKRHVDYLSHTYFFEGLRKEKSCLNHDVFRQK